MSEIDDTDTASNESQEVAASPTPSTESKPEPSKTDTERETRRAAEEDLAKRIKKRSTKNSLVLPARGSSGWKRQGAGLVDGSKDSARVVRIYAVVRGPRGLGMRAAGRVYVDGLNLPPGTSVVVESATTAAYRITPFREAPQDSSDG